MKKAIKAKKRIPNPNSELETSFILAIVSIELISFAV
jgi:hypothetical protein